MARQVKCKICGSKKNIDEAFKVVKETPKAKVNHYYCSKAEYEKNLREINSKKECLDYIREILGVKMIPPAFAKQVNILRDYYDYIVIKKTFKECESNIKWQLDNKEFNSEFAKSKYIIVIISNNIEKVYRKHKKDQEKLNSVFEFKENIDVDIFNYTNSNKSEIKVNDISSFLD